MLLETIAGKDINNILIGRVPNVVAYSIKIKLLEIYNRAASFRLCGHHNTILRPQFHYIFPIRRKG